MVKPERFKAIPAGYVIFRRDGKILLLKRKGTDYYPGYWSLPSGHIEQGESVKAGTIREIREEVGVELEKSDLKLVHVLNRPAIERPKDTRVDFFYDATKWKSEPANVEPEKCEKLEWFSPNALPDKMVPEVEHVIKCVSKGLIESEFDWDKQN